jgi:hypothetical protein
MVVKLGNYKEGLDKAGRHAKKSGKEIESGLNVGSLAIKALGGATKFQNYLVCTLCGKCNILHLKILFADYVQINVLNHM